MNAYCLRLAFGIPTKLVVLTLNQKSYSYGHDRASLGKFMSSQSAAVKKCPPEQMEVWTRIENSAIESMALTQAAEKLGIPIVHVKLLRDMYKHIGYDSKHSRYWTAEDGCRCQACLFPYKVDLLLPDKVWNAIRSGKNLLCPVCIVERLERRGFAAYNLVDTNEN